MKLILVAEDEYGGAEVLQLLLETSGYRVVTATNGKAALELLQGEKPSVVHSDFMMPQMTGADFGLALRSDPLLADIPFIMLSATSENVIQRSFTDYDAYLQKPYEIDDLMRIVGELADGGRPQKTKSPSEQASTEFEAERSVQELLRGMTLPKP